jgi:hypothetical protein
MKEVPKIQKLNMAYHTMYMVLNQIIEQKNMGQRSMYRGTDI